MIFGQTFMQPDRNRIVTASADQQMDQSASGQERTQVSENEPEKDKVIEAQPAFESPE